MENKRICPKCNSVITLVNTGKSKIQCVVCKHVGNATEFEESVPTDISGRPDAGKLYKPGILQLIQTDALWFRPDKTLELKRGLNTLGRQTPDSTCNIQLPTNDSFISRNHATIDVTMKANGVFEHGLTDLGSLNGTFHNGERLEMGDTVKLAKGDTVRLGHISFKLINDEIDMS